MSAGRNVLPGTLAFAVIVLLAGRPAWAQAVNREEVCRATLLKLVLPAQAADAKATEVPCQQLAILIFTSVSAPAADIILQPDATNVAGIFSQRDLQSRHPQDAGLAGTAAQGEAVPSVEPAGVAAGTIAAVGTKRGSDAIAGLSINPVMLFLGDLASRATTRYSRFLDVTLFVPVSAVESGDTAPTEDDDNLNYFGARLRVNLFGPQAGDEVWSEAERLFAQMAQKNALLVDHLMTIVRRAPALDACVAALRATPIDEAAILVSCGEPVRIELDLALAERLRSSLATVRRAADARYFGADVRVDIGDPTLGSVENAKGTYLFAGLSYGQRLRGAVETGGAGFRARLGARHAKLDAVPEAEFAVEGGVGFDVAKRMNDTQEISASGAVEFRWGTTEEAQEEQFQTNFGMFRGTVRVPLGSINTLSLNFGAPIWGELSPTLSVNFNWGLLLSQALDRIR